MTARTEGPRTTEAIPTALRPGLFLWAVGGVALLLGQAIFRLSEIAWEALSAGTMTTTQWAICVGWSLANCYLEGYRGFHTKFVPRVLARAHHLANNPFRPATFLAPLFSMAFFHSTRKGKGAAWGVTIAVLIAIFVVRGLPQPWRGIIDAGVVAGLSVGTLSLLLGLVKRLAGIAPTGDPHLPDPGSTGDNSSHE